MALYIFMTSSIMTKKMFNCKIYVYIYKFFFVYLLFVNGEMSKHANV